MLKDKLIKIERTIVVYLKAESKPVKEINIDGIPFNELQKIVLPKTDDPLLYDGYILSFNQLNVLNNFLESKIIIEINSHDYILECTGIYDW